MKDIIVKLHNSAKKIDEATIVIKDGKPTVIEAVDNVNYEFFDKSIGFAPNHIITKRVDKDLHISFEIDGKESDLIIKDFYSDKDQALVGIAEDGDYYYYIPDTGEVVDYVTQLEAGDIDGQALGGEHIASPLWVMLTPAGLPWWVGALGGLLLAGGAVAALGDDDDDKEESPVQVRPTAKNQILTADEDSPIEVPLIGADVDGTVVSYTITAIPPAIQGALTYDEDGDPSTPAVELIPGTKLSPAQAQTVQFNPAQDFNGDVDPILFTVTDNDGLVSDPATVAINVLDVNDPPTADDQTLTTNEDTPIDILLIGDDVDGTVEAVIITQVPPSEQGIVTFDEDGDPSTPAV